MNEFDMKQHEIFMKEALSLAKTAYEQGEVPVGAVVVCNGEIVGRGYNRREGGKNALAHAEIAAIDEACRTLKGWRLRPPACMSLWSPVPCVPEP